MAVVLIALCAGGPAAARSAQGGMQLPASLSGGIPHRLTNPGRGLTAGNPPQLVSANGSLVFNVVAQTNPTTGFPEFTYNGFAVTPTLRLVPGDTLYVNFTNNLPAPAAGAGYTNVTNLHYHGLHVTPQAPADDSIDMVAAPGQALHYTVPIPATHPTGMYWYHTHVHGEVERQMLSGMSGALIIDGIATSVPQVASMTERVLVVRDVPLPGTVLPNANLTSLRAMNWAMQHGAGMRGGASTASVRTAAGLAVGGELHARTNLQDRNPYVLVNPRYRRFIRPADTSTHCVAGSTETPVHTWTLNGLAAPRLRIAPGEQQFWRLVNAAADEYLDLQVDNTSLQIVALDGVPISQGVGTSASMTVTHWVVPPGSRVEFIVTGPPAGTAAYVRTNCFDAGSAGIAMPAAILATIDPSAVPPSNRRFSSAARVGFTFARAGVSTRGYRSARALRTATITNERTIYYSDQNTINGTSFDPAAPPMYYVQSGTVEEWTVVNNSSQVHTFHIHQLHFLLEAINGTPQAQEFLLDNVNVPAATSSGPGTVKLLLDFSDPLLVGTFLFHCHILSHEDGGMMAKIRVGTAPPLAASASTVTFASPTASAQNVTLSGGTAPYSVSGCSGVAAASVSGSTIAILPAGAGSCLLTVADSSSPSLSASISISVGAAAAVVSLSPTAVSFTSPGAAAQSVTISGGTAPYTASGCGSFATAAISGTTLTVTPVAAGTCSLVVADALQNQATLAVAVNASTGAQTLDNLTFHGNNARTGWYQNETVLTATNVASGAFAELGALTAPAGMPGLGKVYAQPLFVQNEAAVDGKTHNLVIVAGAAGQIYAFDETTQAVVWHRSFTNTAAGIRQQQWSDSGCADISPDDAIVGTPVIDRTLDTLYVVVATMENGTPYTRLHAIGLGTGNDVLTPTVISGSVAMANGGIASISSVGNLQRPALLEANGNIYVGLGSHCDFGSRSVHGWMLAYSATTLSETGSMVDLSNANNGSGFYLASPWMSGFGPAADAQGNVYFATGNGPFDGVSNFAMSVLELPGNLNTASATYFTPITAAADSQGDNDLASGGVMLLPDQAGSFPHILVAGGKCSARPCYKYLLNRDNLGGQQTGNAGALWSQDTGGTMFGGPAYFVDSTGAQHVVYGGNPLNTYNLGLSPVGLTVQSTTTVGCLECRNGGGAQPVVSSNGTQGGTAIVWALKTPGSSGGTITLYAFGALNLGTTLFAGSAGSWTQAAGTDHIGGALISPLVVDGRVYVPTDGSVAVFGLEQ